MLNNPLVMLLLVTLISVALAWLGNQLPSVNQFPGRNILILKLIVELIVLGVILGWRQQESYLTTNESTKSFVNGIGIIVLLFFAMDTFQLMVMLWRGRHQSRGTATPNPVETATPLKSPADWRRELLKVMEIDVTTRLDDSLHNDTMIRLQMQNRQEQVGRPRQLRIPGRATTQMEQEKKIIEVFEQGDISGRLLILGEPGSGKTTTLLELAQDLLNRAQQQPDHPIPVLFELSAWKDDKQSIPSWLRADLKFRYNIPEAISRYWLDTDKLLPLLDGLDELGLTRQVKCVEKINEFLQASSQLLPIVVCCREEEYIKGEAILGLRGAVCLQPLTEQQIQSYLRWMGCSHLWQPIKDDPEGLLELAKMPLLLHLIPVAYPEGLLGRGKRFSSPNERCDYQSKCRQDLFNAYIRHRLEELHDRQGYNQEETKRWLKWLAKTLKEQKQKEFFIEKMQPKYLKDALQQSLYHLIWGLIGGLIWGLIGGLAWGLIGGLTLGTFFLLVFGLDKNEITPVETLTWSSLKVRNKLKYVLVTGLFIALIDMLFYRSIYGVIYGLIHGLLVALMIALVAGLSGYKLKTRKCPNQGIIESAKNALIFTVISWPFSVLIYGLPGLISGRSVDLLSALLTGLSLGLGFGINSGGSGIACIQHFTLRLILYRSGSIPWNYARFLGYAAERRFIQQIGGRYQFIHDLLQEHFAHL